MNRTRSWRAICRPRRIYAWGVAVAFGESWLIANGVSAPKDFSWYRPA